jgi:hypothetical protein
MAKEIVADRSAPPTRRLISWGHRFCTARREPTARAKPVRRDWVASPLTPRGYWRNGIPALRWVSPPDPPAESGAMLRQRGHHGFHLGSATRINVG